MDTLDSSADPVGLLTSLSPSNSSHQVAQHTLLGGSPPFSMKNILNIASAGSPTADGGHLSCDYQRCQPINGTYSGSFLDSKLSPPGLQRRWNDVEAIGSACLDGSEPIPSDSPSSCDYAYSHSRLQGSDSMDIALAGQHPPPTYGGLAELSGIMPPAPSGQLTSFPHTSPLQNDKNKRTTYEESKTKGM